MRLSNTKTALRRPLLNALIYRPRDHGILVTKPRLLTPPTRSYWILPGEKPETDIPRAYYKDEIVSTLRDRFPDLALKDHAHATEETFLMRIMKERSRAKKRVEAIVYVFTTDNQEPLTIPSRLEDVRWTFENDGLLLSPLTNEILTDYRSRGL